MRKKVFAAIDLGTNSCRLVVSDLSGKYLLTDVESVKLGLGMYENMRFTEESMKRVLDNFLRLKKVLEEYDIVSYRYIATAACRMASNGEEFVKKVFEKTGIKLEIIDEKEEARLSLKGGASHVLGQSAYILTFDIGGGSTEVTLAENNKGLKIVKTISIPWGSRNASDAFEINDYVVENANKFRKEIKKYLDGFLSDIDYEKYAKDLICVALSSTSLRIAALVDNKNVYDRELYDGFCIKKSDFDKRFDSICAMSFEERAKSYYIGHRADIFVASCVLYQSVIDTFGVDAIVASLRSAKDGIIKDLVEKYNG